MVESIRQTSPFADMNWIIHSSTKASGFIRQKCWGQSASTHMEINLSYWKPAHFNSPKAHIVSPKTENLPVFSLDNHLLFNSPKTYLVSPKNSLNGISVDADDACFNAGFEHGTKLHHRLPILRIGRPWYTFGLRTKSATPSA